MSLRKLAISVGILLFCIELSTSSLGASGQQTSALVSKGTGISSDRAATEVRHVAVISIPALSFLELQPSRLASLPNLRHLTEQGAVGAMNIRTTNRSMRDVYVTIGAGTTAVGVGKVQAYLAKERLNEVKAGELMSRYTGYRGRSADIATGSSFLLIPDIAILQSANRKQRVDTLPGTLGDLLKEHRIQRNVWGSSDLGMTNLDHTDEKRLRRYGAQMLMDSQGVVDNGAVGALTNTETVDRPFGVRTNYTQLLALWEKGFSDAALPSGQEPTAGQPEKPRSISLIELGDLYRLYADKEHYQPTRFKALENQILSEMDEWLGLVAARMTSDKCLWVFSPEVHVNAAKAKAYLSPTIRYTAGGKGGLLYSESTRRQGVLTVQDFTASLLNEFHIPAKSGMVGLPVTSLPVEHALRTLLYDEVNMQTIYRLRPQLLYPFVTFEMIVLLVSLLFVVLVKKKAAGQHGFLAGTAARCGIYWRRSVRTLLLSLLTAPVIMLLLGGLVAPLTANWGIQAAIIGLVTLFVIGTLLSSFMLEKCRLSSAMVWLGCGTAGIIAVDGCTGAHAMKYSALGYDPMIGARYYGIGNEYMGVLIGALVLGVTAALQRRLDREPALRGGLDDTAPRSLAELETAAAAEAPPSAAKPSRAAALAACAAFLLVTACLAAPSLGANAGGALSAAIAFGVAGARCFAGGRWRELRLSRGIPLLAALLALGLLALWLLNSADSPAAAARESHVGRAFHALREGRFDQIGHLIERKLRMNVHLLRASVWSKILITSLFVMSVLVLRPSGRLRLWQHQYPYWMYGFSANMIGAIAALLLNDSGIVAAATLIIYVAVPMLLLRLQELEAS
ncbi:hypothetical protein ACFQZT_26205 [Paenibacillus sp. GCM10027628]|uniref:hypothetical protein n=1 Tax=Paenibacillus sp. GCM10027628 TaxID=3273413 RepID=UPI00363FF522